MPVISFGGIFTAISSLVSPLLSAQSVRAAFFFLSHLPTWQRFQRFYPGSSSSDMFCVLLRRVFPSSIPPDVIRLRAVYLRCPLSFFLSSFFLPAVLPFPKYAYSGIKWPIFLKKSPFLLHISKNSCTFAPFYHIGTTVKRQSNDGQATVKANVTYLLHQKRAQIYV